MPAAAAVSEVCRMQRIAPLIQASTRSLVEAEGCTAAAHQVGVRVGVVPGRAAHRIHQLVPARGGYA